MLLINLPGDTSITQICMWARILSAHCVIGVSQAEKRRQSVVVQMSYLPSGKEGGAAFHITSRVLGRLSLDIAKSVLRAFLRNETMGWPLGAQGYLIPQTHV